jgi:3-oxoadipate enol-lactonase
MLYHQIFFNPEEDQAALVLLHAFPLDSRMWEPQIEKLVDENIPFLTIDYPGFGRSSLLTKEPSMDDFADEVYQVIKRLNLQKVVVLGLSMGGYVALSLYRNHPDIFSGMILADTRATADSEEGRQRRSKLIEEIRNDPSMKGLIQMHLEKFYTAETRVSRPELLTLAESLMKEAAPRGVIHALQAMANRQDSTDLLGQIPFPVFVIAGEKDSLTSVEDAQAMKDQLQRGRLEIILNAAHLTNLEKPDEFNKSLVQYLSDLGY